MRMRMRFTQANQHQYTPVGLNRRGPFAENRVRVAAPSAHRQHCAGADTYQMERLFEFLERRPSWLRGLMWDLIVLFLREDDGEFKAE
jgi:hypothetical protein